MTHGQKPPLDQEPNYEEELKSFIRIISHDVRASFRHVREFYQYLIEDLEEGLSEGQLEIKQYLENAMTLASNQMDSLLRLSRVVSSELVLAESTVEDIIDDALTLSMEAVEGNLGEIERKIEITNTIETCKKNLVIAVSELIKNAARFTKADETPHITISAYYKGKDVCIQVIDTGIGIDARYKDEIFLPFRRLNHVDDFPGVGMGLTIAEKALIKLGGRIELDDVAMPTSEKSEEQRRTTFTIVLAQ